MINGNKPVGPDPDWMSKAKGAAKNSLKDGIAGPLKAPEKLTEMAKEAAHHVAELAGDAIEGARAIWSPQKGDAVQKKLDLFESKVNPKAIVENIRTAEGTEQTKLLLGFQSELDDMSLKQLDTTMDYIVTEMSDDQNLDDPLLGALAKSVMDETASRKPTFERIGGKHPWDEKFPKLPVNPNTLEKLQPKVIDRLDVVFD